MESIIYFSDDKRQRAVDAGAMEALGKLLSSRDSDCVLEAARALETLSRIGTLHSY